MEFKKETLYLCAFHFGDAAVNLGLGGFFVQVVLADSLVQGFCERKKEEGSKLNPKRFVGWTHCEKRD